MTLAAIVNTIAMIVAAGFLAAAAWHLTRNNTGTVLVFGAALFAPWNVYLSLSGLAEAWTCAGVAMAVFGIVGWTTTNRLRYLVCGIVGCNVAAGQRYEAWFLSAAWIGVVFLHAVGQFRSGTERSIRRLAIPWLLSCLSLAMPLWWIGLNWVRSGDPLHFVKYGAEFSREGVSAGLPLAVRIYYYPWRLLATEPVLLVLIVVLAILLRREPSIRPLLGLIGLQFLAFYLVSLRSTLGDFPERFLFQFILALTPLLGFVPALWAKASRSRAMRFAFVTAGVLLGVSYGARIGKTPQEWAYSPDLLELSGLIGKIAPDSKSPLNLTLGPGFGLEHLPLAVQNGNRVRFNMLPEQAATPAPGFPGNGLWIEMTPARVLSLLPTRPTVVIGRLNVYGPAAAQLPVPVGDCGLCTDWTKVDEARNVVRIPPTSMLGLEFTSDNPKPGDTASLVRTFPQTSEPVRGNLKLRWRYGIGFNLGRIELSVKLDDQTLFITDIGERNRWQRVPFVIPAGQAMSQLSVVLTALPRIEPNWRWGRAAIVLVDRVSLER
jgi:hypothetical protein